MSHMNSDEAKSKEIIRESREFTRIESISEDSRDSRTKLGAALVFIILLALVASCKLKPEIDSFTISTVTPGPQIAGGPTSAPEPQVPYVISGIPHCQGLLDLGYTLTFEWPDIENAFEKLADYNWGYFACSQTQVELKAFMRDKMPKPPYLWQEVAWVEHGDSTGSLYFHSVFRAWIYIWMLRQPDKQNSYLVIAKGDPGMPQTWDCRLILSQPSLTAEARRSLRK